MAEYTSRFVQLTEYILLEYRYTSPILPEELTHNFFRIVNGNNSSQIQLLNVDNAENATGNVQERSVVQISGGEYADLDKDQIPTYLNYDTNLTTTTVSTPAANLAYDTIRFHLVSGYNFEDLDGVIAQVTAPERSGKTMTLANIRFLKDSDFFAFNARPIWLGDRLYDRYFEIKVPSIKIANDIFYSLEGNPSQVNTFVAQTTSNGLGFMRANPLSISIIEIVSTRTLKVAGARYKIYGIGATKTVPINQSDEFALLSAVIQPSAAGDYFEYFASWSGGFIEDYILTANALPENEYIVLHELRVFEQVGSLFPQTDLLQSIQEDAFDEPRKFRPVIINADKAVSFTIEYTTRLYNKIDSSQIIRTSSYTSYDVKKWGRQLQKIKLLNEPEPFRIYNKVIDGPTIVNQAFTENAQAVQPFNTRFVPSFFDRSVITLSQDTVYLDANGQLTSTPGTATKPVYGQGDLNVIINPFDNFFKFTILKTENSDTPVPVDLGTNAEYYMVFINDSGKKLRFLHQPELVIGDPSKGDLVFKVPESEAEKIVKFTTKEFYVISRFSDGAETMIYQGVFNKPSEIQQVKLAQAEIKESQAAAVETKIKEIEVKQDELAQQQEVAKTITPTQQAIVQGTKVEIPGLSTDTPSKNQTSIIASVIPKTEQSKTASTKAVEKKLKKQVEDKNNTN